MSAASSASPRCRATRPQVSPASSVRRVGEGAGSGSTVPGSAVPGSLWSASMAETNFGQDSARRVTFGCTEVDIPDSLHLHPLRRARRARPLLRRCARRVCPIGLWGPWGPRGRARRARRSFSSDVPHRLEQPAPPYEPYYAPHGPHGVRRAVLAGREARADPGRAPARARPSRRPLDGGLLPLLPPKVKIQKCCHARPLQVPRGRGTRTLCCPQ